jgi:hypothetical protein
MKRIALTVILAVILSFLVINYFSLPTLADSAECKSGSCSCSCSGIECSCEASGGTCSCNCLLGGKSSCGKEDPQQ